MRIKTSEILSGHQREHMQGKIINSQPHVPLITFGVLTLHLHLHIQPAKRCQV
jgi:hypothetical protein